jgi:hypothetical protein
MSGLSELKANNLQWSVACIVFSQFLRSCHTSSRFPCMDSLFLFICRTSHMSQISSCNSMILRVRAQSICTIGCYHLCVIHGDLLLTSPSVRCCQIVPSFANALGVFVLFHTSSHVVQWKRCPSFFSLSSSSSPRSCSHRVLLPLFREFSPVFITEHIQKYCSIENFIKLPF